MNKLEIREYLTKIYGLSVQKVMTANFAGAPLLCLLCFGMWDGVVCVRACEECEACIDFELGLLPVRSRGSFALLPFPKPPRAAEADFRGAGHHALQAAGLQEGLCDAGGGQWGRRGSRERGMMGGVE